MPEAENVKVAVRVRPFNKRELGRNAKCIVDMKNNTTTLTHPDNASKVNRFTFDYSYWSFDGYVEENDGYCTPDKNHKHGDKFADQKRVFDDLGQGILKNAWDGYNSSLFAYGQTGSGKSWSIIGYGANKGIVPLFCEAIFEEIGNRLKKNDGCTFEVKLSMLEIYNEIVRDLLLETSNVDKKKGLKVREHHNKGFYADGLTSALVASYKGIEQKMNEGTVNRTVASTNMNETSSRAHTIVTVTLTQKHKNDLGQEIAKTATINLVDLAGSERVHSTGATGERLKEGAAINLSLSSLGNCIHALAAISSGKSGIKVPYRDSVLTKLLMNALGGNSKTVMIAAISPADLNYEETLSTLRYADRAKQIKTIAHVNEDPTDKLIRDLKLENENLKKMLETGALGVSHSDLSAAMNENNRQMEEIRKSYEEKLEMADMISPEVLLIEKEKKVKPHLYNLNLDSQLTAKIVHILQQGKTTIGNHRGSPSTIVMVGPSIQEQHAIITIQENGDMFLEQAVADARIIHNGDQVSRKVALHHNDRVMFGPTQLYVFAVPSERDAADQPFPEVTYDTAMEEIAKKAGLSVAGPGEPESMLLQDDLLDVLPAVQEANSISADLDKRVKFEIALISPQMLGNNSGRTEMALLDKEKYGRTMLRGFDQSKHVSVKMKNLETGQEFVWPKEKFLNRLYLMKEMYTKYEYDDDGNEDWDLPAENDPFAESPDTEVHIGSVQVFLQPIAFMVELKDQLRIIDYKGNEVGLVNVEVVPCDSKGREYTEQDDMFVDDPSELVGKDIYFIVKLISARGIPNRYSDIYCRYIVFDEEEESRTNVSPDSNNVDFKHSKMFSFTPATTELINHLHDGWFVVQVWGQQQTRKSAALFAKGKTTKQMLSVDHDIISRSAVGTLNVTGRSVDPEKQSIVVELLLMKKQAARLQQRVDSVKRLIDRAEMMNRRKVPITVLKDVFNAPSGESAERMMGVLEEYSDGEDSEEEMFIGQRSANSNSSACVVL